ncbi:alanine racemase [Cohnella cellulosilytica]|uniref:Alanine racemase n=1 Tax=Cohnella cellulosilytica TaxID=986710 RepID=A0ABW2FJW5_9BACL
MSALAELPTPAVYVDLDILEGNIAAMAERLKARGLFHRPHLKSHKSVAVARRQLAAGAIGVTAAKLSEAEVFVSAGIPNLLLAYPIVGADKLDRFKALHAKTDMLVTADSLTAAEGLSAVGVATGKPVSVLIEIDGGLHRSGLQPGGDALRFALEARELPGLKIRGLMGYFGNVYKHAHGPDMARAVREEAATMAATARLFRENGVAADIVSTGSTPAGMYAEALEGVTEVRAGNYVFFDASGVGIGMAAESECALRVVATVVSVPVPGRATIDAGTKTLTSDRAHRRDGFGIAVGLPEVTIAGLNEEHGFLQFDPARIRLRVGDRVELIPNHACVLPNLLDRIAGVRSGEVVEWLIVDARGCST